MILSNWLPHFEKALLMCWGGFLSLTSNAGEKVSENRSVDSIVRFPLTEAQKEIWLAAQMGKRGNCL